MTRWAAFSAQIFTGPLPFLLLTSLAAYATMIFASLDGAIVALCGQDNLRAAWGYLTAIPWAWGFGALLSDWVLMIIAMMTPLVSLQLARIVWSTRKGRRVVTTSAFVFSYWLMWSLTIVFLVPFAIAISSFFEDGVTFSMTLAVALIYSSSPAAQRARNRCHRTDPIPAFGFRMVTESVRSGAKTSVNCIAACWPWMVVPLTVQSYHLLAMITVGVYLLAERIASAARPTWRLPPGLTTVFGPFRSFSRLNNALFPQGRRPML